MKTAQFVPTAGYLICPHCHEVIRASDGKTHLLHDDMSARWEANQRLRWQCNNCQQPFSLPANPFKKKSA